MIYDYQQNMVPLMKEFDIQARTTGYYQLFADFLDFLISYGSNGAIPYTGGYEKQCKALVLALDTCNIEPFQDVFGALYEEIAGKGHKSNMGQFFTPEHICDFTAQITLMEANTDRFLKMSEPCCGSGRMILSAGKVLAPSRNYRWWAVDLDYTCARMCLLNCWFNAIPAYVVHGDCLAMNYYRAWTVEIFYGIPVIVECDDIMMGLLREQLGRPNHASAGLPTHPPTLFEQEKLEEMVKVEKREKVKKEKKAEKPIDDNQLTLF